MAAVDKERGLACVKQYAAGAEAISFVVVLFEHGETRAVIEASRLGQLRTGAASAVAAKHLAKPGGADARRDRLRLPGAHAGRVHPRGAAGDRGDGRLLPEREEPEGVLQGGRRRGRREPPRRRPPATWSSRSRPRATRCCAASGCEPGALVCAAGANHPKARELDNTVLERAAFVCCDSLDDAKLESGDLIEPVSQGVLDWLEVHELQEVVAGELPGRQQDDDIVVFKSNGLAAWDLAVAARVVELSRLAARALRAASAMSSPIALITSGRSSTRSISCGEQRLRT